MNKNDSPIRSGAIHNATFPSTCNFSDNSINIGDPICKAILSDGSEKWVLAKYCTENALSFKHALPVNEKNELENISEIMTDATDNIFTYDEICKKVGFKIIQGINFRAYKGISVFLIASNSVFKDEFDSSGNLLYEGHNFFAQKDEKSDAFNNDQPLWDDNGELTPNGLIVKSVELYRRNKKQITEKVIIFEKIEAGIWSEKGVFNIIDYFFANQNNRKIVKFVLKPVKLKEKPKDYISTRMISRDVKIRVWERDKGKCVLCGATRNLQYDHEIPYSKGGNNTFENVRILCAKCNIKKSDNIE